MTTLTATQQEIHAILVETIGAEPTSFEAIKEAVKSQVKIRTWKPIREVLTFLIDGGFIQRTDVKDEESYRFICEETPAPVVETTSAKKPLSIPDLKALCKELKIPTSKTTPRADLVSAIAAKQGWSDEKPEVIEFLLSGGCITEVPGFTGIAPKPNNRETSAGGKVQPAAEKPAKAPRRVSKSTGDKKAKPASDNSVTIQEICEELGIEGRIARRKLRGSDIAKPGDSWTWEIGHEDIQKVKDLLK